ncbi:segregation and condensation protein A [Helcococcus kunzii]|uniref:segregation and condensation protein A n=1 Tax=Helcococcus kunzii TaxID=40091 RepID=UPI00389BA117
MINVSTGEFFGPFDLLLDLIKKSKYDIYEIKLSDITNKYIKSLNELDIPSDETADFILIATQLLYLKTISLIKDTLESDDEDEDIISEDELLRRLIEYKKIKSVIPQFNELFEEGSLKHTKLQDDLSKYKENSDNIEYDISKLKHSFEDLIEILLKDDVFEVDEIMDREEYSLEKYNSKIKLRLIKEKIISITKLLQKVKTKSEAIVIFLSILELSKTKNLFISQDSETDEIIVEINNNLENVLENEE